MEVRARAAMTANEWGLLLLLSLLWGGSFFFVGVAVKALPPFTIIAARGTIAATLLWLAAPLTGVSAARLGRQAAGARPACVAQQRLPVLAADLEPDPARERPRFDPQRDDTRLHRGRRARLHGALIGLCGVAALIGPGLLGGFANHLVAELAALLAALSYAAASVFARRFRRLGLAPIEVATGQVTASAVALLPAALLIDAPWRLPAPGGAAIAAILAIGALSTAFAYVVYFRILAGAGATNVVLVTLLAPATAILLGAAVLGESLAARDFVGLGLIALGLAIIDGRLLAAVRAWLATTGRR
jgi:drug/metabolite transporter (DMT)-like permease